VLPVREAWRQAPGSVLGADNVEVGG